MKIFPKALSTRPRLAVEIRWGGVVAARSEAEVPGGLVAAVSRTELGAEALEPGLKPGNFRMRPAVVAAVRKTLEAVYERGMGREVTLVVPDAVVRVLLLDFDTLPAKAAEALPVVRFRLKKLLPFDADEAQVSYQAMAGGRSSASAMGGKGLVRVVAVATPRAVLEEYEAVVREAGFEPGAVLPSTLAALAGLEEAAPAAALVVNAGPQSVTTAIVERGVLLLHRSVDMSGNVQVGILAEAAQAGVETAQEPGALPLVDREASQQEWAMQQPVPQFGRDPYRETAGEPAAGVAAAGSSGVAAEVAAGHASAHGQVGEVTQAVSVAAAYFEDTLQHSPDTVLSAGSTGAEALGAMLAQAGFGVVVDAGAGAGAVRVQEIVAPEALVAQAASARVPRSWLAGVRGALRS
jgi:type IV pilus assembly protein PilM